MKRQKFSFWGTINFWLDGHVTVPHTHQLKKSNHPKNKKRADFSKQLTVEKENFHFGELHK